MLIKYQSIKILLILLLSLLIQQNYGFNDDPNLEKIVHQGWAKWSEWGPCSSLCGDGISSQLRRCLDVRCVGPNHRERICNIQQCNNVSIQTKETRCSKLNILSNSDNNDNDNNHELLSEKWIPVKSSHQCMVVCRSIETGEEEELEKVIDGTKCFIEGYNKSVCVNGICQHVGCDGIVQSNARYDHCGVCGGTGESCGRTIFQWKDTKQFSPCDATCGPNTYRVSVSVCENVRNKRIVPERLCADQPRPRPVVEKCPHIVCPSQWITGKWSECTASCNGGHQTRTVYCVESSNDTNGVVMENRKVDDQYCWQTHRPATSRKCNRKSCPKWEKGDWTSCSVTCGKGYRTRQVECRQEGERIDDYLCKSIDRPDDEQPCYTGVKCQTKFYNSMTDSSSALFDRFHFIAQAPFTTAWNDEQQHIQHDGLASSKFDIDGNPDIRADIGGTGGSGRNSIIGTQPRFFPGQWGQCSTTCGPGIATRTVECIAIQGITSNIIKLPDYECEGSIKPNEFQPCQIQPCTSEESANDDIPVRERSLTSTRSFKWDYGDWTICSASCLGGKQRSTLKCVDVKRRTAVAWSFCNAKQRPVDLTRSCNNDPCPPEWDIGEMSQCSHTCGGGVRSRKVRCIRRISRTGGAESTLILPDGQCPQPKPVNSEACGLVDCPAMWKITNWGQCSTTCGPGEQRRDVTCEQRLADGELKQFYPPIQCRHIEKPPTVQLCDLGMCNSLSDSIFRKSDNDKITTSMSTFTQQNGAHSRKLTLNIGGSAKLFVGTSLKVKCPVRNYAKNKIIWTKNGKKITNSAHIKVSSNGALRIFHARMEDAGVYACIANGIQGNVTLSFKPREEKDENGNDSRSMLNQNMPYNDVENDPIAVDQQLLQKVRQSLKNNEDFRMLERLADVTEPGNIKIDYAAGEWSKCSHYECGKSGRAQVRQLKCRISYQGSIGYLDDDVCESFGVMRPPSSRSCLPSYCPRWQTSSWSECTSSRCIRHSTSMQRREVKCAYENGTNAAFELCDRESRPKVKKECINVNCTADWRSSVWGQCSRTCGDGGVQMRLLRCVWRGTRKPAGRNCQSSLRPAAIRACQEASNLPECPTKLSTGVDGVITALPNAIISSKSFSLKGLENWRGWKLYDWIHDNNGNFRRKF